MEAEARCASRHRSLAPFSAALSPMLATSAALIVLPQSRRPRSVRLIGWVSGRLIAMQNGGYARAGSTSDGSGASRAPRIAGDVVAGSALTICRAGGLRPVRGKPRF
jgi:hypothetical protein